MTTSDNADWSVHVIEHARSKDQPVASLIQGADADGVMNVPFSFILARRGDNIALVDCGFMREAGGEKMAIKIDVPYWISPLRLLAELDVPPEQVTDIVLSHAHFDHMGSISKFPNARLHLQKREMLSWIEAM